MRFLVGITALRQQLRGKFFPLSGLDLVSVFFEVVLDEKEHVHEHQFLFEMVQLMKLCGGGTRFLKMNINHKH